jgi:hypothetical protein
MSCTLKHKEAINNLKSDLEDAGFKSVPISRFNDRKSIIAHNIAVNKEVEKAKKIVNNWNTLLNKLGLKGSVVTGYTRPYLADKDSSVGFVRSLLDLQFNNKMLDNLDNLRVVLGIYDSKESIVSHIKEKKTKYDNETQNNLLPSSDEISGIDEEIVDFFNLSNVELKSKINELLRSEYLTKMCSI